MTQWSTGFLFFFLQFTVLWKQWWIVSKITFLEIWMLSIYLFVYSTCPKVCGHPEIPTKCSRIFEHLFSKTWTLICRYISPNSFGKAFHKILEAGCKDLLSFCRKSISDVGHRRWIIRSFPLHGTTWLVKTLLALFPFSIVKCTKQQEGVFFVSPLLKFQNYPPTYLPTYPSIHPSIHPTNQPTYQPISS